MMIPSTKLPTLLATFLWQLMWDGMRGTEDSSRSLWNKTVICLHFLSGLTHLTAGEVALAAGNDHDAVLSTDDAGAMRGVCGGGGFHAAVAAAAPRTEGELPTVSCLSLLSDCKRTFRWQALNLAPMSPGSVLFAAGMQYSPAQAL
jgi:hypothetical protein